LCDIPAEQVAERTAAVAASPRRLAARLPQPHFQLKFADGYDRNCRRDFLRIHQCGCISFRKTKTTVRGFRRLLYNVISPNVLACSFRDSTDLQHCAVSNYREITAVKQTSSEKSVPPEADELVLADRPHAEHHIVLHIVLPYSTTI